MIELFGNWSGLVEQAFGLSELISDEVGVREDLASIGDAPEVAGRVGGVDGAAECDHASTWVVEELDRADRVQRTSRVLVVAAISCLLQYRGGRRSGESEIAGVEGQMARAPPRW